jgi:peptide/nickel transport system ATP-binding protein
MSDVRLSIAPEFLKRYPHELNMGAIQRVCLARALVHEPDLLIADEPTSALDPSVQAKVLKMLLNLQIEKGLTLLFVTHNIGLARKVADRIGVMEGGRIIETGPAARIILHPDHEYTQSLIRSARGLNSPGPAMPSL